MSKIILICGAICSGKSTLARRLAKEESAVILSNDELTKAIGDDLGEAHDAIAGRTQLYLRGKAVEIVRAGVSVILEWGFWRRADRDDISRYLDERNIPYEWHCMEVTPEQLRRNAAERNAHPGPSDYLVDEGLLQKCLSAFEPPAPGEMDVIHVSANC